MPPRLGRPNKPNVGARKSEPFGFDPFVRGGLGVIPRRGLRPHDLASGKGLEKLARSSPLRLLKELVYVHPTIDDALWNALQLTCAPGAVRITAVTDDGNGEQPDEEGTKALNALWESLPDDIGGLEGLLGQLLQEAFLTGLVCVEAVPGRRGTGVAEVWPVDSLSVAFRRDDNGRVVPQQRQVAPQGSIAKDGLVDMPVETFFWRAVNPMVDEPYGRAPFAPAVNEALCDLRLYRDVRAAVHTVGTPRLAQGFAFKETLEFATTPQDEGGLGLSLEDADQFVLKQFQLAQETAGGLLPDDVWIYDKAGEVKVIDSAKGFAGLEKILVILRQRLTQGVKTPGTIFGISDGATDTFSTKELEIYGLGLGTIRSVALWPLIRTSALHLQLLGRASKPKVHLEPIRATDALADANTLALDIANERSLIAMGFKSPEESSEKLTGSAPFDPDLAAQIATALSPASPAGDPAPDGTPAKAPGGSPVRFGRAGQPAKRTDE